MDSIYTVTMFCIVEHLWVKGQLVVVSPLEVLGPTASQFTICMLNSWSSQDT